MKKLLGWFFWVFLIVCFLSPDETVAQEFDIRGRLHMDTFIGISDADQFSNGFNNRRARLGMTGQLTDNWDGRVEVDFSGAGVSPNDFRFRRSFENGGRLWLGQFKVPQGLNELTSSNNIRFIERTTVSNIITDARRMGVAYEHIGGSAGFKTMLYGRSIGQNIQGDMPLGGALRGVYAPQVGAGTIHLAGSVAYEDLMDDSSIGFSDRPEARDSQGGRALIGLNIPDLVESTLKTGLEVAYNSGPFWTEAEYFRVNVNMEEGDDPAFNGWHAQAGYVLTGESRAYSTGGFGTISPANDSGAWELALRYSFMDLNDSGYEGGRQSNFTLGVNHYVTSYLRFMCNVIFVNVTDVPDTSDISPVIGSFRAQFHF